jgi:hypothetical protein
VGKAQTFSLGDVVQLGGTAPDPGRPGAWVVVAINTHSDKVRIAKCATERFQAPIWMPAESCILAPADSTDRNVRRARRRLAAVRPDPDGWRRIACGKDWAPEKCTVGHVALDGGGRG